MNSLLNLNSICPTKLLRLHMLVYRIKPAIQPLVSTILNLHINLELEHGYSLTTLIEQCIWKTHK